MFIVRHFVYKAIPLSYKHTLCDGQSF